MCCCGGLGWLRIEGVGVMATDFFATGWITGCVFGALDGTTGTTGVAYGVVLGFRAGM